MPRKNDSLLSGVLVLMAGLSALVLATAVSADVDDREQAKFLHDRLTGTMPTDAMLDLMEAEIVAGNPERAARLAIDGNYAQGQSYEAVISPSGGFYNAVVKNWASPWTNEAQDVFQPLNDYSATIIGMVRDESDFTGILFDDVIYIGAVTPGYSNTNNNHYEALEAQSQSLGDPSVLLARQQTAIVPDVPLVGVAGVLTTRAAARAFFIDGTNRAMFRFTLLNHLCNDLEQYKDNNLPHDRIRQDVSRSPGGDSSIFLNECAGCHTGMDAMAGAFAYHQYQYPSVGNGCSTQEECEEMGELIYTPGTVQPKHLINSGNFRDGYVTVDDHWINYWRTGPNAAKIGWRNAATPSGGNTDEAVNEAYSEGNGMASLGEELANTEAFASCQVKKAFKTLCLREPWQSESSAFQNIVGNFKSGYNMKQAFIEIAVHCSNHLNP